MTTGKPRQNYLGTHRPVWPAWKPRKPRGRVLAILNGATLTREDGCQVVVMTYDQWKVVVTDPSTDVLIDDLRNFPWLDEAAGDKEARINGASNSLDDQPRPVSISWRIGNKWGSLHVSSKWGRRADLELIADLRLLCDHLEAGTYASPGALGHTTQRLKVKGQYKCPCLQLEDDIRDNLIGGRAELYVPPKTILEEAYEVDRTSAYIAEAKRPLPIGPEIRLTKRAGLDSLKKYPVWYAQVTVFRPEPVRYSSFGTPDRGLGVQWPTIPGWFEGLWIWSWQLEDILKEGSLVILGPRGAWAWSQAEPILADWADWIFDKRMSAPTPAVADLVKLVMVAGIGSHLQSRIRWTINARDEGQPLHDQKTGLITPYSAQGYYDPNTDLMTHWAGMILHGQQLELYRRQMLEALAGNQILMSNFDSLLLRFPSKLDTARGVLGSWKETALQWVMVVDDRSLISVNKTRLPGLHGRTREVTADEYAQLISLANQRKAEDLRRFPTARYIQKTRGPKAAEAFLETVRRDP